MTLKQTIVPAAPQRGFVVAMRARLTATGAAGRREWLIVSRWGADGEHLSIAWTRVAARRGGAAPIQLAPYQTALAALLRMPPSGGASSFLFAQAAPDGMRLAGRFAPVEGYARLQGQGLSLRLWAEGRCTTGPRRGAWRIEAARGAWIGEFIEQAG